MAADEAPWVEGLTIGAALRRTAEQHSDLDAYVFPELDASQQMLPANLPPAERHRRALRVSYRTFDKQVDRVAKALLALGIRKGEHVAVWATNWPNWLLLQFATARIGAVMVLINPAYRTHELAYVLKQSDACALFLIDSFRTSDYFGMLNEAVPELKHTKPGQLKSVQFPLLKHVVAMKPATAPGMWSWEAFLHAGEAISDRELAEREALPNATEPVNIQYTSGTTGFPKGAMLTHRNLLLNGY